MATCGSLQHIFEKPLPESPTLLESLSSWNQIKPAIKPIEQSSFTEIFGELHFKENSQSSSACSFPISPFSSTPIIDLDPQNSTFKLSRNDSFGENDENDRCSSPPEFISSTPKIIKYSTSNCHKKSESFSLNSESLQLCTEGLGFESSDEVEDMKNEMKEDWQSKEQKTSSIIATNKHTTTANLYGEFKRSRVSDVGEFPPPISCIGKSGKPWVCFKSYREDGRFVLKEVRIPTQEFLHAFREDGRLKLHFVQPNDEIFLEEEEFEEEDEVEYLEEGINDDIDEGKEKWQAQ